MEDFNKLEIKETRVKKYKKYRRDISSDHHSLEKKNAKKDDTRIVEKTISKIDKNLLVDNKPDDIFYFDFTNASYESERTVNFSKRYLETIKNLNFSDLLNKVASVKNVVDNEPEFDIQGNITTFWFHDDAEYKEIQDLKSWIKTMVSNKDKIINNTAEAIMDFKDAYYKSTDASTIQKIKPTKPEKITTEVNKKNKKLFYAIVFVFFISIILAIIFLIMFFVNNIK